MKVLHLSSERSWRGGEQQIAYLIEESLRLGIECMVACKRNSAFESYCEKHNIPYFALGFKNEFDLFTANKLKRLCQTYNIDIIHAHSSHSHAMAVWSKILGNQARFFLHRRVDFPMKKNFFSSFKFNFKGIEKIICISKEIERVMRRDLNDPDKCTTVVSGIDLDRFKKSIRSHKLRNELSLSADTKMVGNISAIADHKDYFTFVDVAEEVLKQINDTCFVIIGDGPLFEEIQGYISTKSQSSRIIMTGFRDDIPEIIQELDIFLMTSKTEGLGTTILDAFANRIPVVATRAGGIPEAVIHNKTGLLGNVGDVTQLAEYVMKLLEDPAIGDAFRSNAYHHLLANFTKEKMAEGVIAAYQ